jgi:putative flavoprotein involved in K+ transport
VVWATGFRPDYSWLHAPVFDRKGELKHDRGVVDAPGLYVLGLPYLRRRKSSFMHGAEDDVRELGAHLVDYLDRPAKPCGLPVRPEGRTLLDSLLRNAGLGQVAQPAVELRDALGKR